MLAADCIAGAAVIVRAADEFYQFIDGWRGVIMDRAGQAGGVWVASQNPQELGSIPLEFLIPPDQLEPDEKATED